MFTFFFSGSSVWDISRASYSLKNYNATEDTIPRKFFLKPDGKSLYILGFTTDTIYQYTLSTPFDISTASYASKSYTITEDTSWEGFTLSPDGVSMYALGGSASETIYQYTLTTPWDISTAGYASKSFNIALAHRDIEIRNDGLKIYVLASNTIYQYSLSPAFDISTATSDSKSYAPGQDSLLRGFAIGNDGRNVYLCGDTNDNIYQHSLSTQWDISTGSYDSISFDVSSEDATPYDVAFRPSGNIMYVLGVSSDTIYQYSL